MLKLWGALAALAVALAGCDANQAGMRFLKIETADNSYRKIDIPFTTSLSGNYIVPAYYRVFNSSGKLAICGYFINRMTGCDGDLTHEWFKNAFVSFDNKPVGYGTYIMQSRPSPNNEYQARCVETDISWDQKYETGQWFSAKGGYVQVRC